MVRAVSFDIWGTLLDLDRALYETSGIIARELSRPHSEVHKIVLRSHEEARRLRRKSLISGSETIRVGQEILARNLGVDPGLVSGLIKKAFDEIDPLKIVYDDVPRVLKTLSEQGFLVGVAGNVLFWPSSYTWSLLEKAGLTEYVRVRVFSDEIGFNKPDRGFFLALIDKLGLEPSEIAHVGDNIIEDVGGPLSVGMKAILVNRRQGVSLALNIIGVAVIHSLTLVPYIIGLI
ncbi:HAD family hydrolase [Thermogladius sp. 4427co]|uniref:HAD family hydrolase n=1 Tax=Thermogladius sp. 4427co TaxID=3450718 RepID=UPI003F7A02FE